MENELKKSEQIQKEINDLTDKMKEEKEKEELKDKLLPVLEEVFEKKIESIIKELWHNKFLPYIDGSIESEKSCRDQVKDLIEKAELPPLIGIFRNELREIIKRDMEYEMKKKK